MSWYLKHKVLPPAITVLLILAGWIAVTANGLIPDYVIPAPKAVLDSLIATWPTRLASATWLTFSETVIGVLLGVAVAVIVEDADIPRSEIAGGRVAAPIARATIAATRSTPASCATN